MITDRAVSSDARSVAVGRGPRAGRFGPAQAITIELAAMVAAAAFYALSLAVAIAVVAATLLVVVVSLIRVGGRWWYEAVGAWLRLRRRRQAGSRAARAARTVGPYRTEFAALAPYLTIDAVLDRNVSVGIGTDELGWFAAVAVWAPDWPLTNVVQGAPGQGGDGPSLQLDRFARMVAEPSAAPTAVSVVLRQAPLPSAAVDPRSACALSYQELRTALGAPPLREVWVAVRLGLDDGLVAADDGGAMAGIQRTLATALSRAGAIAGSLGLDHRILDAAELREALIGAYGPDPYDGRPVRIPPASESWSRWRATRAVHVCFAVSGFPATLGPAVFAELSHVPGALAVCTAVTFTSTGTPGQVGARLVVRVVAGPDALTGCVRRIRDAARGLRLRLVRLDGEQAAGVYATTPTAAPVAAR